MCASAKFISIVNSSYRVVNDGDRYSFKKISGSNP